MLSKLSQLERQCSTYKRTRLLFRKMIEDYLWVYSAGASYQEVSHHFCNFHPATFTNLKKGEIPATHTSVYVSYCASVLNRPSSHLSTIYLSTKCPRQKWMVLRHYDSQMPTFDKINPRQQISIVSFSQVHFQKFAILFTNCKDIEKPFFT